VVIKHYFLVYREKKMLEEFKNMTLRKIFGTNVSGLLKVLKNKFPHL
jgi:hypothetical protein